MMDVLCLLHVVHCNRYMDDYMVPYHEFSAPRGTPCYQSRMIRACGLRAYIAMALHRVVGRFWSKSNPAKVCLIASSRSRFVSCPKSIVCVINFPRNVKQSSKKL